MNKNRGISICFFTALCAAVVPLLVSTASFAQGQPIPKFLLIQLTRDQAGAMCSSTVFTECMGFDAEKCSTLSEEAIKLCLEPLPDEIDPEALQNSTLEQCPQQIYKKEGFSEDKAKMCFQKALDAASTK